MSRGNSRVEFLENTYYHVFNRGLGTEPLFHNKEEFDRFYKLMIKYTGEFKEIKLLSFSIMEDHFHFVFKILKNGYELSDFMKRLQGAYAVWYRRKYKTEFPRPVFEGRFKSERLDSEEYFQEVLAFVNYNPVNHKVTENIEEYIYSSYRQLIKTGSKKFQLHKGIKFPKLEYIKSKN